MYSSILTNMLFFYRKISDNAALAAIAKPAGKRPVADLQIAGVAKLITSDIGNRLLHKVEERGKQLSVSYY